MLYQVTYGTTITLIEASSVAEALQRFNARREWRHGRAPIHIRPADPTPPPAA